MRTINLFHICDVVKFQSAIYFSLFEFKILLRIRESNKKKNNCVSACVNPSKNEQTKWNMWTCVCVCVIYVNRINRQLKNRVKRQTKTENIFV